MPRSSAPMREGLLRPECRAGGGRQPVGLGPITTVYDTHELIVNKSSLLHDRHEGWVLPAGAEEGSGCSPVKPLASRCSASLRPYGVTGGYPQKGMSSSSCSAMPVGRPRSDGPEPGAGE